MEIDLVALEPLLRAALAEDIGSGDVTTRLFVPDGVSGRAAIVAKASGVLAGLPVALEVMRLAQNGPLELVSQAADGGRVAPGDFVLEVQGEAAGLLGAERCALNFLMRLSGIASLTARFVEAVKGTGARIFDTRKTAPGLRILDKYAVACGGGSNHRFGLDDAVLVKENHLAFGASLADALAARPSGMPAIVEVENLDQFRAADAAGADVVMLDDFSPDEVREACDLLPDAQRPKIEVSGGITLLNVRAYAEAGADRISSGTLTHSAPSLDFSMRATRA